VTCCIIDTNRTHRCSAEEKLDKIGAGLGTLPLHSYQTIVVHEMYDTGREVRLNFENWYLHVVRDGGTDPHTRPFSQTAGIIGTGM
jgi:hypothetical protein